MLTLEELSNHLTQYRQRHTQMLNNIEKLRGAICAVENLINMIVQKQNEKLKGENNAVKEGEQQESNPGEHQDRNCSGKETKPSSSDSLQQSRQIQAQII